MSLFSNLFTKQEDEYSDFNWIPLLELEQLKDVIKISSEKTAVIFKHSTRCGVSRGVIKQFEKQSDYKNIDFYFLDLLNFRDISNAVAHNFDVPHQSPQLLVIKSKKVVAHASHYSIMDINLEKFI